MDYLNIALPKGRLGDKGYELFKSIGLGYDELEQKTRKLILTNELKKIRYILVRASDVPIYVERGAADIGIVGKDIIMEDERSLYEIMDLKFGKCNFAVASLPGYKVRSSIKPTKIATKYPNIAKNYFLSKGIQIDIIKLNGSVELAPLVGLSDAIVDIVETGRTLKENGLTVIEEICPVSARLIANKVSFKIKNDRISRITDDINSMDRKE
ncbi:ATP phosphoribosyltransferase [Brassicibacter mesophilus]|uniref:ATP phosphoribosyltransferase n=1 Tax=Brassicibacter mesophilus TaxID=745119 RepID=UPI003D1D7667